MGYNRCIPKLTKSSVPGIRFLRDGAVEGVGDRKKRDQVLGPASITHPAHW